MALDEETKRDLMIGMHVLNGGKFYVLLEKYAVENLDYMPEDIEPDGLFLDQNEAEIAAIHRNIEKFAQMGQDGELICEYPSLFGNSYSREHLVAKWNDELGTKYDSYYDIVFPDTIEEAKKVVGFMDRQCTFYRVKEISLAR